MRPDEIKLGGIYRLKVKQDSIPVRVVKIDPRARSPWACAREGSFETLTVADAARFVEALAWPVDGKIACRFWPAKAEQPCLCYAYYEAVRAGEKSGNPVCRFHAAVYREEASRIGVQLTFRRLPAGRPARV
jgi:hypothetical protein